jgi:hypothetical protein
MDTIDDLPIVGVLTWDACATCHYVNTGPGWKCQPLHIRGAAAILDLDTDAETVTCEQYRKAVDA